MVSSERAQAERRVAQRFLKAVQPKAGSIVALYWPIGDELDPRPLMQLVSAEGGSLALPVVERPGQPLLFRQWTAGDLLATGHYGIMVPHEDAPEVRPDVIAVPLLGFDKDCHRLGYGGGFYDRTLEALRDAGGKVRAVGIAFERQRVARLPRHDGDQPLDMVITEHAVHYPPERAGFRHKTELE